LYVVDSDLIGIGNGSKQNRAIGTEAALADVSIDIDSLVFACGRGERSNAPESKRPIGRRRHHHTAATMNEQVMSEQSSRWQWQWQWQWSIRGGRRELNVRHDIRVLGQGGGVQRMRWARGLGRLAAASCLEGPERLGGCPALGSLCLCCRLLLVRTRLLLLLGVYYCRLRIVTFA
jgi:hypothetical protein